MKQLNLHFSNNNDIQVIVLNVGTQYKYDGLKNNDNFHFIEGSKDFYEKVKLFADLCQDYSEESWDVIDYGFPLQQFNFFKKLVEAAE
jgi:hypothetical protein